MKNYYCRWLNYIGYILNKLSNYLNNLNLLTDESENIQFLFWRGTLPLLSVKKPYCAHNEKIWYLNFLKIPLGLLLKGSKTTVSPWIAL